MPNSLSATDYHGSISITHFCAAAIALFLSIRCSCVMQSHGNLLRVTFHANTIFPAAANFKRLTANCGLRLHVAHPNGNLKVSGVGVKDGVVLGVGVRVGL